MSTAFPRTFGNIERQQLEPFATVFVEIIVPESASGKWFQSMQPPSNEKLKQISDRIEVSITDALGRTLHPAIYLHALLVCGHFARQAAENADLSEQEDELPFAEEAFALIQHLVVYQNLSSLYLLLA